jgi:hypothetical protein
MAGYRQLHTRMWSSDQWFADLPKGQKLLFIYLFSNERASVSGLYELPMRVIAFETGLSVEDEIKPALQAFAQADKVLYDFEKQVVWVRKMLKYQASTSPKVKNRIKTDVASVPDCPLKTRWLSEYTLPIPYEYSTDTDDEGMDTSSSISISSSIYSSREGEGAGEETKTVVEDILPVTPRQAASHPDIKAYEQITNRFPGDRDYRVIIDTIRFLREKHGANLQEFLTPYWTAWSTRKTKDNKPYSQSSLVWLCEWAMQGEIPRANGHEPQQTWTPIPNVEATRKMLEEKEKIIANSTSGKTIKDLAGRMSKHDRSRAN